MLEEFGEGRFLQGLRPVGRGVEFICIWGLKAARTKAQKKGKRQRNLVFLETMNGRQ